MHEFSIASGLVEKLLDFAEKNPDKKIVEVRLAIGEFTPHRRGTTALLLRIDHHRDADCRFPPNDRTVLGKVACPHCSYSGPPKYWDGALHGMPVATLECPGCGKAARVIEGEECAIRSVRFSLTKSRAPSHEHAFSILLFGFFLGMRHATDSDHVVAVTTIVSRQRKIGSAAWTGIFWGIGHSLTLLVVGGAIILFRHRSSAASRDEPGILRRVDVDPARRAQFASNFRAVEKVSADNDHDQSTSTRIFTAITSTAIPTATSPESHGHTEEAVPPASLDRWFGRSRFYHVLRPSSSASSTAWPVRLQLRSSCCPIIRDPIWALAYLSSSASARSRA